MAVPLGREPATRTAPTPTLVEKKWYHYWRGGHVERIVTEAGATPGEYFVEHFQYNGAQQMWLYRTYTCEADPNSCNEGGLDCAPINVVGLSAWEFRYAGDRQRYLVRQRDPNLPAGWDDPNGPDYDPPYLAPLDGGQWHDYVGDLIHTDFAMNLSEPNNPLAEVTARYHHGGVGAGGRQPADGSLVAMDGGGGFYGLGDRRFFHGDMLGTTRMLTNCAGQGGQMSGQPARMTFTAFGEPLGDALASCPRYGYCGAWGYQTDSLTGATGLPAAMHVGARWYDPASGRFLARDPIGVFGGLNVYSYCAGLPTIAADPWGQMTLISLLGGTLRMTQHALEKAAVTGASLPVIARVVQTGRAYYDTLQRNIAFYGEETYVAMSLEGPNIVNAWHRLRFNPGDRWIPLPCLQP